MLEGTKVSADDMRLLLEVDPEALKAQLPQVEEHLARFGDGSPISCRHSSRRSRSAWLSRAASQDT